ncbi:MAG: DUF1571 domain-containing protein [Paludisphaera borealis]|uniref:DUF1571 domain-containing protein n=1 Tax=Paludisphaera borealis TaxID=1387353 RepID=UPI00283CA2D6|nr:DUF1571 domain-containing protein [Paludisphaera borealis]MDR3618147.1 DUF1571 domain-containing protein [Paludisphaera borealis]
MNRAIDNARAALFAPSRILIFIALASALFETGCASTTAMRASASALAGSIWDRPRTEPTYDLYAQNMAGARGPAPATPMVASNDSSKAKSDSTTPEADEAKTAEDAEPVAAAEPASTRPRKARTDESVRITLGRPESLPVLKEGAPAELAAADTPRPTFAPSKPREEAAPAAETKQNESMALAAAAPPRAKKPKDPDQKLRTILDEAKQRLEEMSTYQVNITRAERVGSQLQPQEAVLLSVRRKPKAVRLEWPTGSSKGREVIYSTAINDRTMYVNMADSALPIPRMSIPIDSPLAMRNSRHTIGEAGFDTIFDNLFKQLVPAGTPTPGGKLVYKGLEKPKEIDQTCHLIQRTTPTKEVWKVYLDTKSLMPVVVTAHQEDGELLECYTYTQLQPNPEQLASADAFDPDKRWGEAKGLFSRLAKAAGDAQGGSPTKTR